jgi:hypothetical protein
MSTKLTLSGDVTYEGEIDNFVAAKVIALVEQGEGYQQPSQAAGGITMLSTGGKTNPQRIAVAGQRSMEESGDETFTSKDISEQLRSGGFSSKNLGRDMSKAVSQGLIFSVTGHRGQYKITDIAKNAFKEGFDQVKSIAPRTPRKSRRGGVAQKLEIAEAVKKLPAEVSLEGYPDYHNLKMKGNRMVWLLVFAAAHGVESLNAREIEYLSRQIGDQISPTSIPSLALSSIRRGLVAKGEGKFRPLEKGKVYLRQGEASDQA